MGFVMDGLDAEAYDRTYSDRQLVGRILRYFRPKAGIMAWVAAMILLNSVTNTVTPILLARGIDSAASISPGRIAELVGIILASGVLAWVFNFIRQWWTARAVGDVVLKLRLDVFAAVMQRDMSFFDEFSSGKIVARVTF